MNIEQFISELNKVTMRRPDLLSAELVLDTDSESTTHFEISEVIAGDKVIIIVAELLS